MAPPPPVPPVDPVSLEKLLLLRGEENARSVGLPVEVCRARYKIHFACSGLAEISPALIRSGVSIDFQTGRCGD